MCEHITKSCVAVADKVWDAFLKEAAPQIKNAEIIAEDNARQNCIGNISACFQKACKDNIDPNDPDGSYDICLTRPESMLNLCKVPLNACGIQTNSADDAKQSDIWDFVVARLASMRVDACTNDVKNCLQSDDRCGKDYAKCIGLDTDTIMRMCPYDKLVGCQMKYGDAEIKGDAVYEVVANMVQGVMLNIDNSFLTKCQAAADEAMIRVCGDTANCDTLAVDDGIGARSLEYKICEYTNKADTLDIDYGKCRTSASQIQDKELGRIEGSTSTELGPVTAFAGVLDGTIYWEAVEVNADGELSSVDEYLEKIDGSSMSEKQKERVESELAQLQASINNAIATIEADPTVQFCMTGREVQGMKIGKGDDIKATCIGNKDDARFPSLTKQARMLIANSALKKAKENYNKKYDELNEKMLQDYAKIGERMAEIQGKNALDARREIARIACVSFSEASILPKSPNPPKSAFGKIMAGVALVGAAIAIPLTGGISTVAAPGLLGALGATTTAGVATTAAIGGAAVGIAGIGLLGNAGSGKANGTDGGFSDGDLGERQLIGSKQLNQWNYKETITSTFEWDTLKCEKCVRSQQCSKTGNPLFGSKYCKKWADENNTCTTTQF